MISRTAITLGLTAILMASFSTTAAPSTHPSVSVGFSPGGTSLTTVLSVIEQAQTSVDVAAYSFTSDPIAMALVKARRRGVNVRVMADKKGNMHVSEVSDLARQKVPVRLNDNYAIMHNKFMIIDNKTLETGSLNYTSSAVSRNAENVLILANMPEVASRYSQEFERLWNESAPLDLNTATDAPAHTARYSNTRRESASSIFHLFH